LLLDQNYLKFVAIIVSYLLCILDRCGKYFGTILNFLRDGSVPLPETKRELEELLQEAKYFCVEVNFILFYGFQVQYSGYSNNQRPLIECYSNNKVSKVCCSNFLLFDQRILFAQVWSLAYSINERPLIRHPVLVFVKNEWNWRLVQNICKTRYYKELS
jgi:hypothetical protein